MKDGAVKSDPCYTVRYLVYIIMLRLFRMVYWTTSSDSIGRWTGLIILLNGFYVLVLFLLYFLGSCDRLSFLYHQLSSAR